LAEEPVGAQVLRGDASPAHRLLDIAAVDGTGAAAGAPPEPPGSPSCGGPSTAPAAASRPPRPRPAGSRVVRLGWFETMPAGLLTATAGAGRTDLLTVRPHTGEPAARAAMDQAAQAGNRTRAAALLAAITTAAIPGRPPAGTRPAPHRTASS